MNKKEFLRRCIEIYSPSGQELQFSKFIEDYFKKRKFRVYTDKVGNIIAEKGSGKPTLLLISHMDTIPGKLPVIEKDGKIYGRGAVDCKSSLAAMVYSICEYEFKEKDGGTIIFTGLVREEDSTIGIEQFIKSNIKPDYAIFGEPTKINQICIGYKGRLCIGYRVISHTGHVASAWQYVNAIDVCLEIWKMIKGVCWQLTESYCPRNEATKYYNKIIPTLTVISGGSLSNCVPSHCEIQIDIRFPQIISSELLLNEIRRSVLNFKEVFQKQSNIEFQILENISSMIDGFEAKGDEIIIGALRWSIFNTIKKKSKLIKKTGTTFINMIGIHFGIPSITYGPGDPKLEHTDNEFIDLEEYNKSIDIYSKFYSKFFEIYHKSNP